MRGFLGILAILVVPGCVQPHDGPPTLTALDAVHIAQDFRPGLPWFSVRGLEGGRPGPVSDFLGLTDDGIPDGPLADGRLSSWAVSLVAGDGLLEVQVFADGRSPVVRNHELPYVVQDEVGVPSSLSTVDSPTAAASTELNPDKPDGVLYTFARNNASYVDSGTDDRSTHALDFLAWPTQSNAWSIALFRHAQPEMTVVTVSSDGELLNTSDVIPRSWQILAQAAIELRDPTPPVPTPSGSFNFTVPSGAAEMDVYAWAPVFVQGEYRVYVTDAAGNIAYDSDRDGPPGRFWIMDPLPGKWLVNWTHTVPIPLDSTGPIPARQMSIDVRASIPLLT